MYNGIRDYQNHEDILVLLCLISTALTQLNSKSHHFCKNPKCLPELLTHDFFKKFGMGAFVTGCHDLTDILMRFGVYDHDNFTEASAGWHRNNLEMYLLS